MSRARILGAIAVVGGVVFGFTGGEYGTLDWWQLKRSLAQERVALDSLQREIDSLRNDLRLLEQDPATQERVARERLGMIRPGELLFIIEEPPREP